jgi:hypothetical protein
MNDLDNLDWEKALEHLELCEKYYTEAGTAGKFALTMFIIPARDRYNQKVRDKRLYDDIMGISL